MKRHLVTGGAGFVGSHLVDRLLAMGDRVIVLDNYFTGRAENLAEAMRDHGGRLEVVRGDVCEPFHFEVDCIWSLACPASPVHYQRNPARTIKTGVLGTLHALELARECGARVLYTSTSEVYGDPLVHPQVEGYYGHVNPFGPRSCYDESKRCGESLAWSFRQQYGVEIRIARLFNTFGPRMDFDDGRVVSNFVLQALKSQPLTVYGDGKQTRSFCYVSDTVEALLRLMASDCAEPVNIGNPVETTMLELAHAVTRLTRLREGGETAIVHKPALPDDPKQRRPDITRARHVLDWEPSTALEEGLKRTIRDFRNRLANDRSFKAA